MPKRRGIVTGTYCVLGAPLGGAPRGEELAKALQSIQKLDLAVYGWRGSGRERSFLGALCGRDVLKDERALTAFVLDALEGVRAKEGLLFLQVDGASLGGTELRRGDMVSVLTAIGVHGGRSAYILHYALVRPERDGKLPYGPLNVFASFSGWEEVRRELGVVQEGLFARYPVLREAVRERKDPILLVTAVERGHVTFAINHKGKVEYVLVGESVFTVFQMRILGDGRWRWLGELDGQKALGGSDEEINKEVRQRTYLGYMPRGAVLELLRGRGDPEEAKRILAMVQLADF
jgi:hypothetical protein